MKILFVCTGNTCRSVMAQFLLNKMAKDKGLDLEALSAGMAAERHFPTPSGVKHSLKERGIDEVVHTPRYAAREVVAWADLIVAMTRGHREHLLDLYPEFTDRVKLFSEIAGNGEQDVDDPIGKPLPVYQKTRDQLEEGLKTFLEEHAS